LAADEAHPEVVDLDLTGLSNILAHLLAVLQVEVVPRHSSAEGPELADMQTARDK
jgi:hypothetical protein